VEGVGVSQGRPARAPYWPDRSAHRRRRLARRWFWVVVVLVLVLPWLGYRQAREWIGQPPGEAPGPEAIADAVTAPADTPGPRPGSIQGGAAPSQAAAVPAPVEAAADAVEAIGREARAGDGDAAVARLEGLDAQVHRDALLADRGSAVRREAARRDLAAMPGVRAAGWVDRMTLLLVASGRGQGQAMIADACRRLAAHGNVSGLAVRVQEVAAGSLDARAVFGECRQQQVVPLEPGGTWALREAPVESPRDGAAGATGAPGDAADAAERRRRQEESLRILSESTPELPAVPQARADP
jgi:hypothetical protein